MIKLSNTEAELKKSVAYIEKVCTTMRFPVLWSFQQNRKTKGVYGCATCKHRFSVNKRSLAFSADPKENGTSEA